MEQRKEQVSQKEGEKGTERIVEMEGGGDIFLDSTRIQWLLNILILLLSQFTSLSFSLP